MKTYNKLLGLLSISVIILISSCKSDPNSDTITYEIIATSPVEMDIRYRDADLSHYIDLDYSGTTWSKEIKDVKKGEYNFSVTTDGPMEYDLTLRIYYEGKLVKEQAFKPKMNSQNQYICKENSVYPVN